VSGIGSPEIWRRRVGKSQSGMGAGLGLRGNGIPFRSLRFHERTRVARTVLDRNIFARIKPFHNRFSRVAMSIRHAAILVGYFNLYNL
jgi:hypothetical protein